MKPFSTLTGREQAIELLRWLCVPVAALAAALAMPVVLRLLVPPPTAQLPGTPPEPMSDVRRYVLPWIAPIVMGLPLVVAGGLTAPRRRTTAAIVLAAVWTVYAFLSYMLVHMIHGGHGHYAHFAVAVAAGAAGAVIVHYYASRGRPEI